MRAIGANSNIVCEKHSICNMGPMAEMDWFAVGAITLHFCVVEAAASATENDLRNGYENILSTMGIVWSNWEPMAKKGP